MGWARQMKSILLTNSVAEGLQLLLKVVAADILGPHIFGIYTLLQLLPQYAEKFFRFGIDDGMTYLAARARERSGLFFFNVLVVLMVTSIFSIVVLCALHESVEKWILKEQQIDWSIYFVTLLQIPPIFMIRASTKRLLFFEDIAAYNLWSYIPPLLAAIGIVSVAFFFPNNLFYLMSVTPLAFLVGAIGSSRAVFRQEPLQRRIDGQVIRQLLQYGRKLYVPSALTYMHFRSDVLLLGIFLNPTDVGIYALAALLAQIVFRLATAVSALLYVKTTKKSAEEAVATTINACRYALLCSTIIAIPLLAVIEAGVNMFLASYDALLSPLYWLLPAWLVMGMGYVLQHYYFGIGKPKIVTIAVSVSATLNIVLNIVLIPINGIVGAAMASFISYVCFSVWLIIAFAHQNRISWRNLVIPRKSDFLVVLRLCRSSFQFLAESKAI